MEGGQEGLGGEEGAIGRTAGASRSWKRETMHPPRALKDHILQDHDLRTSSIQNCNTFVLIQDVAFVSMDMAKQCWESYI